VNRLTSSWSSLPALGKIGIVALVGVIGTCCCLAVVIARSPQTANQAATIGTIEPSVTSESSLMSSDTPLPTATQSAETSSAAPDSPTEVIEYPLIPDLTVVDVTSNVTPHKLSCNGPHEQNGRFLTSCSDNSSMLFVDITGPDSERVDWIDATVVQAVAPSDEIAGTFLGFIATMPYNGSSPSDARAWVEATLPLLGTSGEAQSITIGSVKFTLSGDPVHRDLTMEGITP